VDRLRPFAYGQSSGPLSRVSPTCRFLSFLFVSIACAIGPRGAALPFLGLSAILFAVAGLGLGELLPALGFMAVVATMILPLNLLGPSPDLLGALDSLGRVASLYLLSQAFFASTRLSEIEALLRAFQRLVLRGRGPDVALMASLTLGFIPELFALQERGSAALSLRSARGLRRLSANARILVEACFAAASSRADALEARSYDPARRPPIQRPRTTDAIPLSVSLIALFLSALLP
jgi:energy-coupling factor transporter transmembrane protein EcfT